MSGIPAFVSKAFRHTSIYVRTDRIKEPPGPQGQKVGVPEYQLTANVWARAILEDDFGVTPVGHPLDPRRHRGAGRPEKITVKLPPGVRLDNAPEGTTISRHAGDGRDRRLHRAARPPSFIARGHRMWAGCSAIRSRRRRTGIQRTGIFPIMHLIGVRRDPGRQHPWLPVAVLKAFEQSKSVALAALSDTSATKVTLPFVEETLKSVRDLMGDDFWSYGVEPNRKTLETFLRHHHAQGLSPRLMQVEEMFHPSVYETFKL